MMLENLDNETNRETAQYNTVIKRRETEREAVLAIMLVLDTPQMIEEMDIFLTNNPMAKQRECEDAALAIMMSYMPKTEK